jgi:hypothetical protein
VIGSYQLATLNGKEGKKANLILRRDEGSGLLSERVLKMAGEIGREGS